MSFSLSVSGVYINSLSGCVITSPEKGVLTRETSFPVLGGGCDRACSIAGARKWSFLNTGGPENNGECLVFSLKIYLDSPHTVSSLFERKSFYMLSLRLLHCITVMCVFPASGFWRNRDTDSRTRSCAIIHTFFALHMSETFLSVILSRPGPTK